MAKPNIKHLPPPTPVTQNVTTPAPVTQNVTSGASISRLASALTKAIEAGRNSGSVVADFCAVARGEQLPTQVPEEVVIAIADAYAANAPWKDKPDIVKVRKSEARQIIRAHAFLPEAIKAWKAHPKSGGACSYVESVRVARAVNAAKGDVGKAIAEMTKKNPVTDPRKDFQRAVNTFYKKLRESKAKNRNAELELLEKLASDLKLELKKD